MGGAGAHRGRYPHGHRRPHARAWLAAAAAIALALASSEHATAADTIASSGPLTSIRTSADLNCDVDHAGDDHGEFFGETACGTLVAVDGTLYGPAEIPAGGSASPRFPWEPAAQASSGSGTAVDPYRIVTVVKGGGISVTQTDTYVVGAESYGTRVAISNTTGSPLLVTLYRVADCYLKDNDFGYGALDATAGTASCIASPDPGSRIEQWAPVTPGSHRVEAFYDDMWAAVGTQQPFGDTCACDVFHDNAAGLSWTATIAAGATSSFSHLTAFSPTGNVQVADSDGDGFPDAWESPNGGVDTNGDGAPDLKLSDYGATPDRPDVFVQVGSTRTRSCRFVIFSCRTRTRRPSLAAIGDVEAAFAARGVRLHVDAGAESVMNPDNGARWGANTRATRTLDVPDLIPGNHDDGFHWGEAFDGYRSQLLPPERSRLFHFVLYVGSYDGGHSGLSRHGDGSPFAGRDFMLAYDDFDPNRVREAGTFMHELGHNLGLSHGGSLEEQSVNFKPNYPSVMNYAWQMSGTYKHGHLGVLDYSDGRLEPIHELALREGGGLDPDSAASDVGTKWSCPETRSYKGPSASSANVDWNCNGQVEPGTVATNVNNPAIYGNDDDPSLTQLFDHDDWHSLLFDGGGGLGGAGDPVSAQSVTPVDEAPVQQLDAAVGDLHSVTLSAPGGLTIQSHTLAPVKLTLVNRRPQARTYALAVVAHGVTLSGLPAHVTLAPNARRTLKPLVSAGAADDEAYFEVDASSDDPVDADSAIAGVTVVDGPVRGQPRTAALVAIADDRAIAIAADGGRAQRLRRHAVGPARALPAGQHTLRIVTRSRGRARGTTVHVTLRPHQLGVLLVSTRGGRRPHVRTLSVAPGRRSLLSLVPGRTRLHVGARRVRTVRHGQLLTLRRSTRAVGVGARDVRLGRHVQLVVLTQRGGRVAAVTRRGR